MGYAASPIRVYRRQSKQGHEFQLLFFLFGISSASRDEIRNHLRQYISSEAHVVVENWTSCFMILHFLFPLRLPSRHSWLVYFHTIFQDICENFHHS
jgi:hypothetical protein